MGKFYDSQSMFGKRDAFSQSQIKRMLGMSFDGYYSQHVFNSPRYDYMWKILLMIPDAVITLQDRISMFKKSCHISYRWYQNRQLFYRVYPNVIDYIIKYGIEVEMTRIKTGIDMSQNIDMPAISFEFMKDVESDLPIDFPKSMIIAKTGNDFDVLRFPKEWNSNCIGTYFNMQNSPKSSLTQKDYDRLWNYEGLTSFERVLMIQELFPIGMSMVFKDPNLLDPVVMPEDVLEYEKTGNKQLIEKAHRKNTCGVNFGKNVLPRKCSSKKPHPRRGGNMILRKGIAGRTEERIVPRRGTFINGYNLKTVPNGTYLKKNDNIAYEDIFPDL